MKKIGWYAGSAALVLVIGGGLVLLAANLYVQSKGAQQQIRHALTVSLGMPAELTKTTITPWEGLRIDGITIRPEPGVNGEASPDVLKADSFRVRFALFPLIQRRFVVTEILLDHPQLAWAQDARGRWTFPPEKAEKAAPPPEPPAAPPTPEASPSQSPEIAAATPPPAPSIAVVKPAPVVKRTPQFSVDVDKFRLRHGVLAFLDRDAGLIGRFEEVNLDARLRGPRSGGGTLWFDKAELPRAGLMLTKFESRFTYDDAAGFSLAGGKAEIGGGQIFVDYSLKTAEAGSPFDAQCHFDGVALEKLAPAMAGLLQGRLRGVLKASGLAGDPKTRRGEGHFSLLDGKLKEIAILKTLGDALRIEDLSHLELKTAQLDCHLEGEQLSIDSLNLVGADIRLAAKGVYDSSADRLDLQARLIIDQAVGRQLPQFIEGNFVPMGDEAPGSRYVDFSITGPAIKPSTNFLEKVLTGPMGNLFQNILAPKPKNPNKKPKKNQPTPNPSPEASPSSSPQI